MTRQRSRESLSQTIYTFCPYCIGSGLVKTHESIAIEIERAIKKVIHCQNQYALKLIVHPELNKFLDGGDKDYFLKIANLSNAHLEFALNDNLHLNEFVFYSKINGEKIET